MSTNIQDRFNRALNQLVGKAQHSQEYDAKLGSSEGELWSDRTRSMVWARIELPTGIVEREVYCRKVMPVLNLPVTIKKHRKGFWEVIEEDPSQAPTFWGGTTVNANVGVHGASHLYGSFDPTLIDGRQFMHGRVYPTDTLSLSVNTTGVFFKYNGVWKYVAEDEVDLSALVPTSVNMQRIIVVGVDKESAAWDTVNGDEKFQYVTGSIPFTASDIETVLADADSTFEPIAAVRLYGGQTYIRQYDIFHSVRSISDEAALPLHATMWHDEDTVLVGNDISVGYAGYFRQDPPADGDSFRRNFTIAAGTYTLYIKGRTDNSCGIVDWYLDDVEIESAQDWYSATDEDNVIKTVSGVVISTGGNHTLKAVIDGKNASSSDYYLRLLKYWIGE